MTCRCQSYINASLIKPIGACSESCVLGAAQAKACSSAQYASAHLYWYWYYINLVACSFAIVASFTLGGCVANMPLYPWSNAQHASVVMAERDGHIHSFSATCRILLNAKAGAVELRGALVAKPTNYLRFRAWKLSRTVFDITLNQDGLFVYAANRDGKTRKPLKNLTRDGLMEASTLLPGFLEKADWTLSEDAAGTHFVRLRTPAKGQGMLTCQVDKHTLTTSQCDYLDASGASLQTLRFSEYRLVDGVAWPMRIEGQGEGGVFEIRFDDAQINPELNPQAFVPSRRAVKQP